MHSIIATAFPIAVVLTATASASYVPSSFLVSRDAELEEALLELQVRDAEASPYDEILAEIFARDPEALAEADPKINKAKVLNGLKKAGKIGLKIAKFFIRDAEADQDQLELYAREAEALAEAEADPNLKSWFRDHKGQIVNGVKKAAKYGMEFAPLVVRDAELDEELLELYTRDPEAFADADVDDDMFGEMFAREANPDPELEVAAELYVRDADAESWLE